MLCLGDSVTFGLGLADAQTYPARLEEALRAMHPELDPMVVNAGVPGYSMVQGDRLLAELAPLAPDVVVWWFGMNDAKPALGVPDGVLRPPGRFDDGPLRFLRRLRLVRCAEVLGASLRDRGTRVPVPQAREVMSALEARAAGGGPALVVVGCPSRLGEKLAQMDAIAAAAQAEGATRLSGDALALSLYVPTPEPSARIIDVKRDGSGTVAVLGAGSSGRRDAVALPVFLVRRDTLARWKDGVDAVVGVLPPDALTAADLFGTASPSEVFLDNCHLTAEGCALAAKAIAARIDAAIRGRSVRERR